MLRIIVVGINYAPEQISTGKYTSELCETLSSLGHSVHVVTAPPYYPAWRVWPHYRRRWFGRENRNGVDLVRCPIYVPRIPSALTRILHLCSFAISSALALASHIWKRPDVIINIAPALASAPNALIFAKLRGSRTWLHIQDFELDAALDMHIVTAGWLRRFAQVLERVLLGKFDRVSTISDAMYGRLLEKGVDHNRALMLPNWVDLEKIKPLTDTSSYRPQLGIPQDAVVALYSGNMGLKQGLELLAQAAHSLSSHRALHFVFGGQGPGRAELEAACADLNRVHFLDLQPADRLNEWLGLADIHLLPQRADVADLVMPSKLTGMLASGRPVLATAATGSGLAGAIEGCGEATPPGDLVAFVSALRGLAEDEQKRKDLGVAARRRAEATLSREKITQQWQQELLNLCD